MWKNCRVSVSILGILALLLVPTVVLGATTATVDVNATPQFVSIAVNVSAHDFGVVAASSTENTGTANFGITNVSTVETDNTIVADGWSGTSSWTWGTAGENTALLNASDGDGAYDVEVDDTTPIALSSAVAASTNWEFELQLEAPTVFTHGAEQTTTVTISAAAT